MKTPDSVGQQKRELNAEEHKIATSLESFQHLEPKDRVFLVLVADDHADLRGRGKHPQA